jgi:hypothetical protein
MRAISLDAVAAGQIPSGTQDGSPARVRAQRVAVAVVVVAAFALYWLSSFVLMARAERGGDERWLFGADTGIYMELAKENAGEEIGRGFWLDRAARFHPVTVVAALTWMKALNPLTPRISREHLLGALFAAAGALGVWAAMRAFAAVVPCRQAVLWGSIYATSLSVWYFASIEESKAVAAALTALYVAAYLHLRKNWSPRGAVVLTAILLVACLNEIVAAFLLVIPLIDALVRRGWRSRQASWIGLHALAVPVALLVLEGVVNGHWVAAGTDSEGGSHLSMLIHYVRENDFSLAKLHVFLSSWLFFDIAAPTPYALGVFARWPGNKYFEPVLANYLSSPLTTGLVVLFAVMLVASLLPRREAIGDRAGILLALSGYALLRGAFFFMLNPLEGVLFSAPAVLPHMLLIGIPFAASRLPAKEGLLAAFALLLFIVNGTFMIGR